MFDENSEDDEDLCGDLFGDWWDGYGYDWWLDLDDEKNEKQECIPCYDVNSEISS